MTRPVLGVILLSCSLPLLGGCYLWTQGSRMISYMHAATPIARVVRRPGATDSLKQKLELVEEIRTFAVDSVGLRRTADFTTFIPIDKRYLLDVVSAAGKVDFTPFSWCYPLMGCWPLRGYFDKADADSEASRLSRLGYDVYVGKSDGFSTLGFFPIPIYSFMQGFSVYRLANLIIHELTHATLYVKNQVDFDEQFACFTGSQGALRFVAAHYGDTSTLYGRSLREARDDEAYDRLIRSLYDALSTIYKSDSSQPSKLLRKQAAIGRFKEFVAARYDSIFQTPSYRGLEKADINNAFISSDIAYSLDLSLFYRLYEKECRDLRATTKAVVFIARKRGDCMEHLRAFLDGESVR